MTFEQGPIRPPSEAESLLIRVNRNCPWNQCLFCPVYKQMKFSRRSKEEVKQDVEAMKEAAERVKAVAMEQGTGGSVTRQVLETVYRQEPSLLQVALWLYRGGKNVFLQDADSMVMPAEDLAEILAFVCQQFPTVERITTYARSKTVARRSVEQLRQLKEAGLTRVHIGMETGHDPLLEFMRKGSTAQEHIQAGLNVKEAGLSLSEYIILGLGGTKLWREHALDTARVLNQIDPHFIRLRTLAVREGIPLQEHVDSGEFQLQHDDDIVREERLFLEHLQGSGYVVSDHILNLLEEVEGKLPGDIPYMLGVIDRYLELPEDQRTNFRLGRRMGLYRHLVDMQDRERYYQVEALLSGLQEEGQDADSILTKRRGKFV